MTAKGFLIAAGMAALLATPALADTTPRPDTAQGRTAAQENPPGTVLGRAFTLGTNGSASSPNTSTADQPQAGAPSAAGAAANSVPDNAHPNRGPAGPSDGPARRVP